MSLFDRFKKDKISGENALVFDHQPFKPAVMQKLMYESDLLGDKYDGGDRYFAQYPDAAEASEEVSLRRLEPYIEEGMRFFREFPVPQSLAAKITELYVGEELDIYYRINPQRLDFDEYFEDGRDFDITDISERELRQFPNLGTIVFNMYHEPPEELARKLKAWGVRVNPQD